MISLLLAFAAAAQGTTGAHAAVDPPEKGTLIGCMHIENGAGEAVGRVTGFGIYLAYDNLGGPVSGSSIFDPAGIIGRSGFTTVTTDVSWIELAGANTLLMVDTGGQIYQAELDSETGWKAKAPLICQLSPFVDREQAFADFNEGLSSFKESVSLWADDNELPAAPH